MSDHNDLRPPPFLSPRTLSTNDDTLFMSPDSIHGVEAIPSTKHLDPASKSTDNDMDNVLLDEKSQDHPEPIQFSLRSDSGSTRSTRNRSQSITGTLTADFFREQDAAERDSNDNVQDDEDQEIDSEDQTVTIIFCCLCIVLVVVVAMGIYLNRQHLSPQSQDFSQDPEYPECNPQRFDDEIKPIISSETSSRIKKDREDWSLLHDQYEMSWNPMIVDKVLDQIQNEDKELVLLYGAIERHKGTLQLFDSIEQRLEEAHRPTMWIYDLTDLEYESNGTVHERINCLLERSDEWSTQHPDRRLLVVLDHITHYFQHREDVNARGVVWNRLDQIHEWKTSSKWTLFVVESDPTEMTVQNKDWSMRIFTQNQVKVETICIPFTGSYFFERSIRTLTTKNPDIITMKYGENTTDNGTERWNKLKDEMRAFSLEDTFHLYHDEVRVKAQKLEQQGNPIVLQFDVIEQLAIDHNTRFHDSTVERMEKFAKAFGQSIYIDDNLMPQNGSKPSPKAKEVPKPKVAKEPSIGTSKDGNGTQLNSNQQEPTASDNEQIQPDGKGKTKDTAEDRVLKKKFIWVMLTIAVILLILLSLWSCGLVFPNE